MTVSGLGTTATSEAISDVRTCPSPVFVIGAPRSGTTVLGLALGQHSQLWTSGESYVLHDLFGDRRVERAFVSALSNPSAGLLKSEGVGLEELSAYLGLGINALFTSRSGGRRWVDHTPHHAYMAPQLATMFPGARFVHILRHGRHVVHSMTHFLDGADESRRRELLDGGFAPPWSIDFEAACLSWSSSVDAALDFAAAAPDRCLTIVHEHVSAEPEKVLSRVLEFLGLEDEPGPARVYRAQRVNSSFPGRRPGDTGADPSSGWTDEQRDVFASTAGETLSRYERMATL